MGGWGSGRRAWGYREKTDDCLQLDIRWAYRRGFLQNGSCGSIEWSSSGGVIGRISFQMTGDSLLLQFRYRRRSIESYQDVEQRIRIERTPCYFGGEVRLWFVCPNCGRRIAMLYLGSRLVYFSQYESVMDRLMRKCRNIRKRLGADNDLTAPIWERPKGMHEKTFLRLKRKAESVSRRSMILAKRKFGDALDW